MQHDQPAKQPILWDRPQCICCVGSCGLVNFAQLFLESGACLDCVRKRHSGVRNIIMKSSVLSLLLSGSWFPCYAGCWYKHVKVWSCICSPCATSWHEEYQLPFTHSSRHGCRFSLFKYWTQAILHYRLSYFTNPLHCSFVTRSYLSFFDHNFTSSPLSARKPFMSIHIIKYSALSRKTILYRPCFSSCLPYTSTQKITTQSQAT